MHFILFTIFAALPLLLTRMAGAEYKGKDKSWDGLGDDTAIEVVLKVAHYSMAGDCEIGSLSISGCVNVGKDRIEANIDIAMQPENGTSGAKLVDAVCQKLVDQVKSNYLKKGGTIWAEAYLVSEGHEFSYIHGKISTCPKKKKNCKV